MDAETPPTETKSRHRAAFTVTVEIDLADRMDAYAKQHEMSRSAVVAEALEALLELEEVGQ